MNLTLKRDVLVGYTLIWLQACGSKSVRIGPIQAFLDANALLSTTSTCQVRSLTRFCVPLHLEPLA